MYILHNWNHYFREKSSKFRKSPNFNFLNHRAQYNLGVMYMYYKGQSVERNLTKARELFASVAAQGYEAAINGLQVLDKEETRR